MGVGLPRQPAGPSQLTHTPFCEAAPSSLLDMAGDQGKMQIIFQKKVVRGKDVTLTGKKGAGDLTSVLTGATSSGEPASASTLSTCQAL